jgi:hypothetical protein
LGAGRRKPRGSHAVGRRGYAGGRTPPAVVAEDIRWLKFREGQERELRLSNFC